MRWRTLLVVFLVLCLPGLAGAAVASEDDAVPAPRGAAATKAASGASSAVRSSERGPDSYWPKDGNGGTDARHYDIRVRYDFAKGLLTGRTTVTMRATTSLRSFSLDLLLPVTSVKVDGKRARFRQPNRHELRVVPRRALRAGAVFEVEVRYAGRPARYGYAGERNWLADAHEVVTMNQPHMAPWWFPSNDHPSDKATFDVRVSVPKGKKVVSNGVRAGRKVTGRQATTRWRMTDPMATYLAFFAAGDFAIEKGRTKGGIPFYNAVSQRLSPGQQRTATTMLRRTAQMTDWLEGQLGDYPFASTGGLVTSLGVGFALENQTRPTYGSWIYPSVIVHEIAHQWFGDSVSVDRWRDIWLNEGFATYMEVAYDAAHGGPSVGSWLDDAWQATCRAQSSDFWRLDLSNPGAGRIFDSAVYDRGAMVVAALGQRIGAPVLRTLLRRWVATHHDGNASVAEFEALAETVSGQDLDGFFDAWLRSGKAPAGTQANGLAACS